MCLLPSVAIIVSTNQARLIYHTVASSAFAMHHRFSPIALAYSPPKFPQTQHNLNHFATTPAARTPQHLIVLNTALPLLPGNHRRQS
jgi:hypothetical protein